MMLRGVHADNDAAGKRLGPARQPHAVLLLVTAPHPTKMDQSSVLGRTSPVTAIQAGSSAW